MPHDIPYFHYLLPDNRFYFIGVPFRFHTNPILMGLVLVVIFALSCGAKDITEAQRDRAGTYGVTRPVREALNKAVFQSSGS
jgi:hypothetical protein